MANKNISRRLHIYINGQEVQRTLTNLRKEYAKAKAQFNRAPIGSKEWVDAGKKVNRLGKELAYAQKEQGEFLNAAKSVTKGLSTQNKEIKENTIGFGAFFNAIRSGDLDGIKQGFTGMRSSLSGLLKTAKTFIATPIGAAIAVIAGVGFGIKKWFEFNIELEKTNQLVRDLTQESDRAVDAIRIRAEILQEAFGVELQKSIETAKSLVKNFGISYDEAFGIIEDGAIRGKHKTDDFLESLKEYSIQFKNAGFSAYDFASIVNTGIDLSIYTDKLPDAIKEFHLSITEQTKATKEAMENAFGSSFTNQLFNDIKNGAITPKEALKSIASEAEQIGLNTQQAQQLTADLFRGAGEDAGGALKIFKAVNIALNEQKKPLTEIQQIQKEQLETNRELKSIYTQLFASGSKGFNLWIQKGKLLGTQILIKILKAGVDLYNWFVELNNESSTFSAIITTLGKIGRAQIEIIILAVKNAGQSFSGLGDIIKGVFTLNADKVKQGFNKTLAATTRFFSSVKNKAISDWKDIQDAWHGKKKLEKVSLSDFIAEESTDKITKDNPLSTDNKSESTNLTPEDKRIMESKKKLAEFLDQWEADREIQKELRKLEKSEREEGEEVLKLEAKFAKMEEEAGLIQEKEEELSEANNALKKRLEETKEEQLAAIRKKYADKRFADKKKRDQKDEKELKAYHKRLVSAEMALENAKKNALNFGIKTLISAFGEKAGIYKALFALEKGLAISEILNSTSKAIATANANEALIPAVLPPGIPNPMKVVSLAATAKNILAAKINSGIQIATIVGSSIKGFKDGGFTESLGYKDHTGEDVAGVVHADEYVVPKFVLQSSDPAVPQVVKYLENKRLEKIGFNNGGHTTTPAPEFPEVQETTTATNDNRLLVDAINRLNANLENGIEAYVVRTFEEYVKQKEINAEHEQLLKNTRQ